MSREQHFPGRVDMGRQIVFLMTDDDETAFVEFVRSTGEVQFLPRYTRSADPPEPMPLPPAPRSVEYWEQVSIINRSIPWRLSIKPARRPAGFFFVDPLESNVIEWVRNWPRAPPAPPEIFDIPGLRDRVRCGRVWVDGPIFCSQPEFGKWYERIARWLNKHYIKIDEIDTAW